jgi:hypothetical protein
MNVYLPGKCLQPDVGAMCDFRRVEVILLFFPATIWNLL